MKPRFIIEQRINFLANKYSVFSIDDSGNKGQIIAYAQQKRLAFKEKVTFYSDQTKASPVFTFRAEKMMDIHGKFFVEDPDGKMIGAFRKDFGQSLLKSTWHVMDDEDKVSITVSESNAALAILRRFVGYIPIIGDILDLIVIMFRYHFDWTMPSESAPDGKYEKTALFRDYYRLSMSDEAYKQQDWRVLAALCVALDALQGR